MTVDSLLRIKHSEEWKAFSIREIVLYSVPIVLRLREKTKMNIKSKKTNNPKIAGTLSIISGALGTLGIINYWIGLGEAGSGFGKGDMPPFVPSIIFGMPIPALIIALLALTGGIFALRRNMWPWALIGAIAAALSFILLGIPAIILIAITKDEFN